MDKLEALENFILSDVLNAPLPGNLLEWDGKTFIVGGRQLSEAETKNLIESAKALRTNDLWKLLLAQAKREGMRRIAASSQSWEDVRFGKALLYTADIFEKKVENASRLKT